MGLAVTLQAWADVEGLQPPGSPVDVPPLPDYTARQTNSARVEATPGLTGVAGHRPEMESRR